MVTLLASIIGLLIVSTFVFFLYKMLRKPTESLRSSWTGVVTNKDKGVSGTMINGLGAVKDYCNLYIKTDEGKDITITVTDGLYQQINIGDKVKKEAGERYPSLVS